MFGGDGGLATTYAINQAIEPWEWRRRFEEVSGAQQLAADNVALRDHNAYVVDQYNELLNTHTELQKTLRLQQNEIGQKASLIATLAGIVSEMQREKLIAEIRSILDTP